jgi:peroxiredoxin Q/BCP
MSDMDPDPSRGPSSELTIGDTAPDFRLPASAGRAIALGDYRGRKHVVLFFVRAYG